MYIYIYLYHITYTLDLHLQDTDTGTIYWCWTVTTTTAATSTTIITTRTATSCDYDVLKPRRRVYDSMPTAQRSPDPPFWAFGGNVQFMPWMLYNLLLAWNMVQLLFVWSFRILWFPFWMKLWVVCVVPMILWVKESRWHNSKLESTMAMNQWMPRESMFLHQHVAKIQWPEKIGICTVNPEILV